MQDAVRWAAASSKLPEMGRQWVREVLLQQKKSPIQGVQHFGRGPEAVQVLQSSLHVALQAKGYVAGVRSNILAGGDSVSR